MLSVGWEAKGKRTRDVVGNTNEEAEGIDRDE